jgi:DNA-directed RNA polymerase specialized sigma24 family protein
MGSSDSDADLVRQSLNGNAQFFNKLVERHGSKLLHSAYSLTDDWDEAMDVV